MLISSRMRFLCNDMEELGKGIGNAARSRIIDALSEGPKTVSELTALIGVSQSAVSQHMRKLKACRVVTDERRGQEVFYNLNRAHIVAVLSKLVRRFHTNRNTGVSVKASK